jgi:RNA polymerase sigma factor (sigma-70 family)
MFAKYQNLIRKVAWTYARSLYVDVEDLIQYGFLLLVERFQSYLSTPTSRDQNSFKRSVILHLRREAIRTAKRLPPTGIGGEAIDLDRILQTSDADVLSDVYAREYRLEIQRMLDGVDRYIFDLMISGCTDQGWVAGVARVYGVSQNQVYKRVVSVRQTVSRYLQVS